MAHHDAQMTDTTLTLGLSTPKSKLPSRAGSQVRGILSACQRASNTMSLEIYCFRRLTRERGIAACAKKMLIDGALNREPLMTLRLASEAMNSSTSSLPNTVALARKVPLRAKLPTKEKTMQPESKLVQDVTGKPLRPALLPKQDPYNLFQHYNPEERPVFFASDPLPSLDINPSHLSLGEHHQRYPSTRHAKHTDSSASIYDHNRLRINDRRLRRGPNNRARVRPNIDMKQSTLARTESTSFVEEAESVHRIKEPSGESSVSANMVQAQLPLLGSEEFGEVGTEPLAASYDSAIGSNPGPEYPDGPADDFSTFDPYCSVTRREVQPSNGDDDVSDTDSNCSVANLAAPLAKCYRSDRVALAIRDDEGAVDNMGSIRGHGAPTERPRLRRVGKFYGRGLRYVSPPARGRNRNVI